MVVTLKRRLNKTKAMCEKKHIAFCIIWINFRFSFVGEQRNFCLAEIRRPTSQTSHLMFLYTNHNNRTNGGRGEQCSPAFVRLHEIEISQTMLFSKWAVEDASPYIVCALNHSTLLPFAVSLNFAPRTPAAPLHMSIRCRKMSK